jgi:hypothetical protein
MEELDEIRPIVDLMVPERVRVSSPGKFRGKGVIFLISWGFINAIGFGCFW